MQNRYFRNADEVLGSGFLDGILNNNAAGLTRVLKSARFEDLTYRKLRSDYPGGLDELEQSGRESLKSIADLVHDTFQSFYSIVPKRNDPAALSETARLFNSEIMERVMSSDEYLIIKQVCEGKPIQSYEAVLEFSQHLLNHLGDILSDNKKRSEHNRGKPEKAVKVLDDLMEQRDSLRDQLRKLAEKPRMDEKEEKEFVDAANQIKRRQQQIDNITQKVSQNLQSARPVITEALSSAAGKAQDVDAVLRSWGSGAAAPETVEISVALLKKVNSSPALRRISRQLGRMKEIAASSRKNSMVYMRGAKHDVGLGGDIKNALACEFAYLAMPETRPIFYKKAMDKTLLQYKRRERSAKSEGDIIVCLDTSGSMRGEPDAWAKAVALTLLDIAASRKSKCALIVYSAGEPVIRLFLPGQYAAADIMEAACLFQGGGTDFKPPLEKAIALIESEGFCNADIVFLTDGQCSLQGDFQKLLAAKKAQLKFSITGIVMAHQESRGHFSLTPFCERVYRLEELAPQQVERELFAQRVA